jgi:hypothetical protein
VVRDLCLYAGKTRPDELAVRTPVGLRRSSEAN